MKRIGLGVLLFAAVAAAQAAILDPLDEKEGFADLAFGRSTVEFEGLLSWGQKDGLNVYVAEMDHQIAGVRFEARLLHFWNDKLLQIQLLTSDVQASRAYFKLMLQTYGRPVKLGSNHYQWTGQKVSATYAEEGKTATVTYASVPLVKEWQRKARK